ncbi:hypothetical protein VTL71DRAFT_8120 [Oculimacula yallundae]|uniref:Uncharacterized protein n=1 Tax=Oculimacula yallundae TaxID=86028 RepID=A0ABR4CXM8_9HELO
MRSDQTKQIKNQKSVSLPGMKRVPSEVSSTSGFAKQTDTCRRCHAMPLSADVTIYLYTQPPHGQLINQAIKKSKQASTHLTPIPSYSILHKSNPIQSNPNPFTLTPLALRIIQYKSLLIQFV